jgi:AcrR family transcriptional regulator
MSIQMTVSLLEKTNILRRQHILDAAAEVFSERGFNRTSIRDIANAAGVADGTIYNVFENKEALLMALVDRLAVGSEEPALLPDHLNSDPALILKHLLEERLKAYTPLTMAILRVVLSQALIDPTTRKRFHDCFIVPVLKGMEPLVGPIFENEKDRKLTTPRMVLASLIGLNVLALLDDDQKDETPSSMAEPLADMLWRGLGKRGGPALGQ